MSMIGFSVMIVAEVFLKVKESGNVINAKTSCSVISATNSSFISIPWSRELCLKDLELLRKGKTR